MRGPRTALIAGVVVTAATATATILRAQQRPAPEAPASEAGAGLGASDPSLAQRSPRQLLTNGLDYLDKYRDYDRALRYLREAQRRPAGLDPRDVRVLADALDRAERGKAESQAEAGPGSVAASGPRWRRSSGVDSTALASSGPARSRRIADGSPAPEPIQRASAESVQPSEPAAMDLPTLPSDPATADAPPAVDPADAPPRLPTPAPAGADLPPLPDAAPPRGEVAPPVEAPKAQAAPPVEAPKGDAPAPPAEKRAAEPIFLTGSPADASPADAASPAPTGAPADTPAPTPASADTPAPADVPPTIGAPAPSQAPAPMPSPAPLDLPPARPNAVEAPSPAPADAPAPSPAPADAPEVLPRGEDPAVRTPAPAPPPAVLPRAEAAAPADAPPLADRPERPAEPPAADPFAEVAPGPAAPSVVPGAGRPTSPSRATEPRPTAPPAPRRFAAQTPSAAPAPAPAAAAAPSAEAESDPFVSAAPAPEAADLPPLPNADSRAPMADGPADPAPAPDRTASADRPASPLTPEAIREVEELWRKQDEETRRNPPPGLGQVAVPGPASDAMETGPTSRLELPRAPSPTEPRPIRVIPVPEEFVPLPARVWEPNRKYWAAAATCHMPLYFQDAVLERYGQGVEQAIGPKGRFFSYPLDDPRQSNQRNQLLQPMYSAGLFITQIALWPYNLIMDPPWEAEYDLGYYRPGDKIPGDTYYLPRTGIGPPLRGKRY